MTTIKATCPSCGDVDLTPDDLIVTVAEQLGWCTYSFRCRECTGVVRKTADDEVVALLSSAGVRVERLNVPLEYVESQPKARAAAPISDDELLDFALWLGSAEDIVTALAEEG